MGFSSAKMKLMLMIMIINHDHDATATQGAEKFRQQALLASVVPGSGVQALPGMDDWELPLRFSPIRSASRMRGTARGKISKASIHPQHLPGNPALLGVQEPCHGLRHVLRFPDAPQRMHGR